MRHGPAAGRGQDLLRLQQKCIQHAKIIRSAEKAESGWCGLHLMYCRHWLIDSKCKPPNINFCRFFGKRGFEQSNKPEIDKLLINNKAIQFDHTEFHWHESEGLREA